MGNIFTQPYPFRERDFKMSLFYSVIEGIFLYVFLAFFQPFGISEWIDPSKKIKLLGFALITSFFTFFNREILKFLFPSFFKEEKWVVWKEILQTIFLLIEITLGNMIYSYFILNINLNFTNFFFMVIGIGIFPVTFWIMIKQIRNLKKYSSPAIIKLSKDTDSNKNILKLIAENEKDILHIKNLLYIESSDNYATVFFEIDNSIKSEIIRSSLNRLESQIPDTYIKRCHRSYIVNLQKVVKISGNAQGYKFHFQNSEKIVPVARKYSELVKVIN